MHYLFLLLLFPYQINAATKQEIKEAQASIKALIAPLIPGAARKRPKGTEKFRVDTCEKHKINWGDVLMMRKSVSLDYSFKTGCDIQGSIVPKVLQSFPAELKLRNLDNYDKIQSQNKITAGLEAKPLLFLEMRSGVLSGKKGKVKFEADYQVRINAFKPNSPLEQNKGGEIRINEIYGQKVNIKEKIIVK